MTDDDLNVAAMQLAIAKESAKLKRDLGEIEEAIAILTGAVETAQTVATVEDLIIASPTDAVRTYAFEMADCLGMIGGLSRRSDRLEDATAAFAEGSRLEGRRELQLSSSYNSVNLIRSRLEAGAQTTLDLRDEILEASALLEEQVRGVRRRDRWAWADLGDCRLLAGDLEGGIDAYLRFRELARNDALQIESALRVLGGLSEQLARAGDVHSETVRNAAERLRLESFAARVGDIRSNVELQLEVHEQDSGDDPGLALAEWLGSSRAAGVAVNTTSRPGVPGAQDGGLTILMVVLGSKAVVELAKGIHTWLQSRKNEVTIKSTGSDGSTSEIVVNSLQSLDEIAASVRQLSPTSGG